MPRLALALLLLPGCYLAHERGEDAAVPPIDAELAPRDASRDAPRDAPDAPSCAPPPVDTIDLPPGGGCVERVVPSTLGPFGCGTGGLAARGVAVRVRNPSRDRLHVLMRARSDSTTRICFAIADPETCACVAGDACATGSDLDAHGVGTVLEDPLAETLLVVDAGEAAAWLRVCSPPR